MIHGRADLHERLQQEQFPSKMETRVLWHEGPALDDAAIASGLALGCLTQDIKAFDLSRTLKARPPIKEIFPWGELGLATGLVGCMGLVLGVHAMKLDESYVALRAENSQHVVPGFGRPGPLGERQEGDGRTRSRPSAISWRAASSGPPTRTTSRNACRRKATLTAFNGRSPLDRSGKRQGSRDLLRRSRHGPAPAGRLDPPRHRRFSGRARQGSALETRLCLDRHRHQAAAGQREQHDVNFTIICLGRGKGAARASQCGKDDKAGKESK